MHTKILPPTGLLIATLLMLALHLLIPAAEIVLPLWNLLGLISMVMGIAINLSADQAFHQARTAVKPFEEPTRLVTSGVFRLSRNPMYLGFMLTLIGLAVLLGDLTPFLVIPLFFIWIDRVYIPYEEQSLALAFGSEWLAYKEKTPRWL